jgi:hypothetical protein
MRTVSIGKPRNLQEVIVALADLERDINRLLLKVPSGQVGGTATSPVILGVQESGGPTLLTIGSIANGQALKRVGNAIIGF